MEAGFLLAGRGRVGGGELLLAQEGGIVLLEGFGCMHVAARADAAAAAAHGRHGSLCVVEEVLCCCCGEGGLGMSVGGRREDGDGTGIESE